MFPKLYKQRLQFHLEDSCDISHVSKAQVICQCHQNPDVELQLYIYGYFRDL